MNKKELAAQIKQESMMAQDVLDMSEDTGNEDKFYPDYSKCNCCITRSLK